MVEASEEEELLAGEQLLQEGVSALASLLEIDPHVQRGIDLPPEFFLDGGDASEEFFQVEVIRHDEQVDVALRAVLTTSDGAVI